MSELKPCPFCGVVPAIGLSLPDGTETERAYVRCKNQLCLVRPSVSSVMQVGAAKEKALSAWNKRK